MKQPDKKDYGYITLPGSAGGWVDDKDEQAYEAAILSYAEYQREVSAKEEQSEASFILDFDGLRENVLYDYNELVKLLRNGVTPLSDVTVDGYELDRLLAEMRRDILLLCSLMPDDIPSLISKEDFEIEDFDIESLTA